MNYLKQLFKYILKTTIAKDISTLLHYKKTILFFLSSGGETKNFRRSLEAIDYAFSRTNYQLQKLSFRIHRRWWCRKIYIKANPCKAGQMWVF